jgi:hypothetical protein
MQSIPIRVDLDSPTNSLDPMSRIDLGKVTVVQNDASVKSIGKVNSGSMDALLNQHREVCNTSADKSVEKRGDVRHHRSDPRDKPDYDSHGSLRHDIQGKDHGGDDDSEEDDDDEAGDNDEEEKRMRECDDWAQANATDRSNSTMYCTTLLKPITCQLTYQELRVLRQAVPNMVFCFDTVFGLFLFAHDKSRKSHARHESRNIKPFAKPKQVPHRCRRTQSISR